MLKHLLMKGSQKFTKHKKSKTYKVLQAIDELPGVCLGWRESSMGLLTSCLGDRHETGPVSCYPGGSGLSSEAAASESLTPASLHNPKPCTGSPRETWALSYLGSMGRVSSLGQIAVCSYLLRKSYPTNHQTNIHICPTHGSGFDNRWF